MPRIKIKLWGSKKEMEQSLYEALYDYEPCRPGDLSFTAGDELEVVGRQEGGWWKAVNKRTGQEGYIPHNFIQKKREDSTVDSVDGGMESLGWYLAKFDCVPTTEGALFFNANQRMEILEKTNKDWWYARISRDGKVEQGYVPADFVTPEEGLSAEPWYFSSCTRPKAQEDLLLSYNSTGSFLVRDAGNGDGFSLSVRLDNEIKHYRIRQDDQNRYYISSNIYFDTVPELITYYQNNPGLCTKLSRPCQTQQILSPEPEPQQRREKPGIKKPDWEIERNTIQMEKKLGSGQFGDVWKAYWNGNLEVAVKSMKAGCMEVNEFMAEAETMQKLKHPRLVKLYGLCTYPPTDPLYIVCEFVPNGALLDHLRNRKRLTKDKHPTVELINMGAQVAAGMAYLESQSIVHRDLAARNVLIGEGINVKIADFGLARMLKEEIYQKQSDGKVPVKWTAPEALQQSFYTSKSDVWSYGILLFEIITHGDPPYGGMANCVVLNFLQGGKRMEKPQECPNMLFDIMMSCWELNPDARPSFKDLKAKMDALKALMSDKRVV